MNDKDTIWTRDYILLSLSTLFMSVAFYFIIPVLPVYIEEALGPHKAEIGYILSAYTLSALLIRPFTGLAIDLYGRKYIFIISFIIFSGLFYFYSLAGTFAFLFFLRLTHGFAWGTMSTTSSTIVVDLLPVKKRGEGIGYYGLAMTLAMAMGPFIAVAILGKGNHYNLLFYSSCVLSFIGVLLSLSIKYPIFTRPEGKTRFHWNTIFEKSSFIPSLNAMILLVCYGSIISFITIYGKEIGIEHPGIFFLPYAVGLLVARIIAGKLFDRKGPLGVVTAGIILIIIGFPLLAFVENEFGFYSSSLIIGTGIGVVFPTSQAMVNNLAVRQRRGAANSTLFTAVDLGIGLGMLSTGYFSDLIGLQYTFAACAGINLLGLLFFYLVCYPYYKSNYKADLCE